MREVTRDSKWQDGESEDLPLNVEKTTGPSESELIIITLLMRLYDLQYAQLYCLNPTVAEEVFESHDKGELGNPKMYIPEITEGHRVQEEA